MQLFGHAQRLAYCNAHMVIYAALSRQLGGLACNTYDVFMCLKVVMALCVIPVPCSYAQPCARRST